MPGSRRSPRKAELKPVYVINITLPGDSVDNCIEPAKTIVHFAVCPVDFRSIVE